MYVLSRIKPILSVFLILALLSSCCLVSVSAGDTLQDSGLDYTESVGTIVNPGMGYTKTLWYTCAPGNTPVCSVTPNSLVLMFVDIGAFSSGVNGSTDEDGNYTEGTDYDLDDAFFTGLRGTFENCRQSGCTIALRFRYDAYGKSNPEPASFDQVLHHIDQIRQSGLLEEYQDILMFVESGFVGAWGEQHSGKYTSLSYKAQLLDAMLDCVPDPIPVTVRTWDTFAEWLGLSSRLELEGYTSAAGSRAARVGMYNDGYMGSDSDLGTYPYAETNRPIETGMMYTQCTTAYFGGEFSGNLEWARQFDTYLPENAIPEMYLTHLSYINGNIYQLYKDYTFGADDDVEGVDNSAYYGQTVYQFMRDHLGYRFVLRDSDLSASVEQGGTLTLDFKVENTGFANPIRQQKAEIILEKDGVWTACEVDLDSRSWASCSTSESSLRIKLPGSLEPGKWNVYLRLSVGNNDLSSNQRTVRFANDGLWYAALGGNLLGSFTITEAEDPALRTDASMYQIGGPAAADGELYYCSPATVTIDGTIGTDEWADATRLQETDDSVFLVKNDADYVYIAVTLPADADAPVYNLQWYTGPSYENVWNWYYLATKSGYVYTYRAGQEDTLIAYSGNTYEMAIPLHTVLGLEPGVTMTGLRPFIQDQDNSWVATLFSPETYDYTIQPAVNSYTAHRDLTVNAGESLTLTALYEAPGCTAVWQKDGQAIDVSGISETGKAGYSGTALTLTDISAADAGSYTVCFTDADGQVIDRLCVADVTVISEEEPVLTAPTASVSAARSSSKLTVTGCFDQYADSTGTYPVTGHGLVYITSTKLGSKTLTLNTSGRTKVSFSSYRADGSFSYSFKPVSISTKYVVRAWLTYTDADGQTKTVYSDPLVVKLSSLS